MRVWITVGLVGAALVSLAACNKPASGTGGASAPAGAAPAASGPVTLQHFPHRKPGLWTQTVSMDGASSGPGSSQICIDAATETKMSAIAQKLPGAHCDTPQFSQNLDGSITFASNCAIGAGKTETTGTIKGDFNSSYTTVMDTKYSGLAVAAMNGEHKMAITATWTGPCAPGQRGGDMILANGMKVNIIDREAAPPSGGGN